VHLHRKAHLHGVGPSSPQQGNLVRIGDHDDNDDRDDDGHVDDDDNDIENGDFMVLCYVMVLWTLLIHCLSYLNTSTYPCRCQ